MPCCRRVAASARNGARVAVLVDRGGRELPIEARFIGKQIELPNGKTVRVRLTEIDKVDEVVLY